MVVIDDHPLKITSGIGVKFVAVPSSLILEATVLLRCAGINPLARAAQQEPSE